MSATLQDLHEAARRAQERSGEPDATVSLMMERWWPTDGPDPERVQLFKTSGPWGEVGFRWSRCVNVRFRADEVLAACDQLAILTATPLAGGDR